MRYTKWDPELKCWTVPCLYKPDGEQITFRIYEEPAEVIENNKGKKMRSPSSSVPKVCGEVIDRLAELENQRETDVKTIGAYEDRLRHLLRSKAVRLFDEYDPKTGTYARNIKRLDDYIADWEELQMTETQRQKRSEALQDFHRVIAEAAEEFAATAEKLSKSLRRAQKEADQ